MVITNSKTRQRVFGNRGSTLLKLTSQLATLCDIRACIVIHNPEDVNRPWRIWPENEAALRGMIEMYKKANGSEASNRTESKASDVDSNGGNGLSVDQVMNTVVDLDRRIAEIQNKIDLKRSKRIKQAVAQDSTVVGMGSYEYSNTTNAAELVAVSTNTTNAAELDGFNFDTQLWDENEGIDIDDLMNFRESVEDKNSGEPDGQLSDNTEGVDFDKYITLSKPEETNNNGDQPEPEPELVSKVGSKRKAVEQVYSFSELMPPSLLRRKLDMTSEVNNSL